MMERLVEPRDEKKDYTVRNINKYSDSELQTFDNWRFFLSFPNWAVNAVFIAVL